MVAIVNLLIVLAGAVSVEASSPKCCAADKCFASAKLPPAATPVVSAFCKKYINKTPGTVTRTVTATAGATQSAPPAFVTVPGAPITQIVTAPQVTSVVTETQTQGQVSSVGCSTTIQTSLTTQVNYPTRSAQPARVKERGLPAIPSFLSSNCNPKDLPKKISSACSCFLTSATTTVTATQTQAVTIPASTAVITGTPVTTVLQTVTQDPTTITTIVTATSVSTTCTSTSTIYEYTGALSCGIPSPTVVASGSITCPNVAPPGETNARFRIEGGSQGTIYEDCVSSGPRDITTPSGGTHRCDGTNNGANPSPGSTLTTQLDAAADQKEFTYDGSYSNQFQDFFITRIAETSQSSTQFWGLLTDLVFTPSGGCQWQSTNGPEGLWAFDAFNANAFLKLDPQYQVVQAGQTTSITLNVRQSDGNGSPLSPASGASVNGATSDSSGNVQLTVPTTPGCYQYKATRSGSIRSNAFYLTVLPPS